VRCLVSRRRADWAHFVELATDPTPRALPCGFRAGEARADNPNLLTVDQGCNSEAQFSGGELLLISPSFPHYFCNGSEFAFLNMQTLSY